MCRRRLLKSNFYINYGGTKKAHGETVIVSPFVAGGDSDTFELYARNPWVITNNLSWLTVSSLSDKSGKYTITLTATENQAYGERSGSFTAKTLDNRFNIVVNVSQQAKDNVTYRNLTVDPTSLILGKDDVRNGKTLKAYVDEYVNGVYHERVDVTLTSNWTSANNSIATVTGGSYAVVKPVYGSGFFPDERTTTIIAVYNGSTTYEGTNRATCNITVEPEGYATHYISVEPTTATIGSTGEVQLTVLYHTVTDGVDDGGVDVTSSAEYTDNGSNLIDVNTTGKVNGSGAETGGNAVVTVSYAGFESVDVPITVRNATIGYRNFRVIPLSMTLGKNDVTAGKQIQAYVDVFVNNVFSEELEVTADASWSSQHTNIASVSKSGTNEVVKPVYGAGYFPTTRTTQVQASYLGSAATCDVTVEPKGYVEKYIKVTPSSVALGATGSTQLTVKLYTKTDGVVDAGTDVTTSCSYASNSQIITVNNGGVVTANNTGETEATANITVRYTGVDSVIVPVVSSPANIEHELLLVPQGSTTLGFEEGCTFKLYYITKINGTEVSREEVTSNITWDPIAAEKGHMAGTTFMNEWFSTAQTTVDVCATYNGIKSNNVVLTLNGADSITYALVVTPSNNSINYNGTSQMSAEYVTYVNGAEYNRETVQPSDVSWSENSAASTISKSGLLTASNDSSANTVTVTVTGTYLGVSGTANVTIGKAPGIPEITLSVGGLTYRVVKSGNKNVDSVRFQTLMVGVGNSTVAGSERTFENVSSGTSSSSSTWSSTSFVGNVGETIKATLHLYLYPTSASVDGNVILQAMQQTFTGTQVSHSTNYYVYEFNIGTVPSTSGSLGNFTVSVPIGLDIVAWLNISGELTHNYSHDASAINRQSFPVTWANVNVSSIAVSNYTGLVTGATITGTTTKYLVVNAKANESTKTTTSKVTITGTSLIDGRVVSAHLIIRHIGYILDP